MFFFLLQILQKDITVPQDLASCPINAGKFLLCVNDKYDVLCNMETESSFKCEREIIKQTEGESFCESKILRSCK